MSQKKVVVKKRHFYTIFSHKFQFYDQITARNCIFHDDLKTRNNLGAAREIWILIAQKNELIWFLFHFFMFSRFFSTHRHWATTTPLGLNRHGPPSGLLLYYHQGSEKSKTWHPEAANTREYLFGRNGFSKKCNFFTYFWPWFSILPSNSQFRLRFLFFSVNYD